MRRGDVRLTDSPEVLEDCVLEVAESLKTPRHDYYTQRRTLAR